MADAEMVAAWPGLVRACGIKFTDPQRKAKRARRWSPIMALAVWQLVRHLDTPGAGRVHLEALKAAGLAMWTRDSFYRHLRDAESMGLVHVATRKRDGVEVIEARGVRVVAELLELPSVGARKVSIPLASLKSAKTFKRALWAAWHAGRSRNTGAPITRGTLRDLSGLPESTQRRYECNTHNGAGARVTVASPNAVVVAEPATPRALAGVLAAAREFIHGGCFVRRGLVLRPIGNTYTSTLPQGSRSKARKLNRTLSNLGLVSTAAGQPSKRLFFADRAKAERAARHGRAVDVPLVATGEKSDTVTLWRPVWDSWALAHVAGV